LYLQNFRLNELSSSYCLPNALHSFELMAIATFDKSVYVDILAKQEKKQDQQE
jgi:hypothetical protein